ncbi:hypothetical protein EVAR_67998_1 [Eumeta japonica]|uniref:Uncharacterized protein n=1 Tax=Eumeta variegata TaxID=151549 RepID=A0A4C2AFD0_EUMVA|nr:hypothetical protein EVAR_67998_1 [Eumeta japonica]
MALRAGLVKAAILILDSGMDVEDQTLIDENIKAAVITAGSYRIGVMSVYFEGDKSIGPYLVILGAMSTNGACGGAVSATTRREQNSSTSSMWRGDLGVTYSKKFRYRSQPVWT